MKIAELKAQKEEMSALHASALAEAAEEVNTVREECLKRVANYSPSAEFAELKATREKECAEYQSTIAKLRKDIQSETERRKVQVEELEHALERVEKQLSARDVEEETKVLKDQMDELNRKHEVSTIHHSPK